MIRCMGCVVGGTRTGFMGVCGRAVGTGPGPRDLDVTG